MASNIEKITTEKLTRLFVFREKLASLDVEKQALKDRVIPMEVKIQMQELQKQMDGLITDDMKQQMADIEAEFQNKGQVARENAAALEQEIRKDVLNAKVTFYSLDLAHRCEFRKGSVKWNDDALKGFSKEHPAILDFRTEENPTTRIV